MATKDEKDVSVGFIPDKILFCRIEAMKLAIEYGRHSVMPHPDNAVQIARRFFDYLMLEGGKDVNVE